MPRTRPPAPPTAAVAPRLSIRLDLGPVRIGPGKVALLEEISRSGSISAAGRALKMSYRRAWLLVEDLNTGFGTPLVETLTGGSGGGGARLTDAGEVVVRQYRAIEAASLRAANKPIMEMLGLLPP